jgi:hypothetical protein
MTTQENARVSTELGETNMQTVWSDIATFFKNIWAEIIGFFNGLFGNHTES